MMKKIAYITDIHLDEEYPIQNGADPWKNWELILKDISNRNIREIIFGGDIGEKEANKWFFDSLKDFKLFITPGNHDHYQEIKKHFQFLPEYSKQEMYSSFTDSFFKYIFLDSSSGKISENQLKFLKEELQADKPILLFLHHPVLEVNTWVDKEYPLAGREIILEELKNSGKEITIFCGHYHMINETSQGKIKQYISHAASFQIRKADTLQIDSSTFGYRIITIGHNKIDSEVLLYRNGGFEKEEGDG